MNKNATYDSVIFGANGQDGYFMARYLLKKNKKILAVIRSKNIKIQNLKDKYKNHIKILIIKNFSVKNYKIIFKNKKFKKIYFFAGYSKIPSTKIEKKKCITGNYLIFKNFLYTCLDLKIKSKILYLSSGEIFGSNQKFKKKENNIMKSDNCYSECKIKSLKLTEEFRNKYNFFISNAICYNHESIFTPKNHIIRKIINNFDNKNNKTATIYNSDDVRNISHVYDFLPIFSKILDFKKADDYIVANNENISLKNISLIFNKFYNKKVLFKKKNINTLSRMANNLKIKKILNYSPTFHTEKLLIRMISYHKRQLYFK
jgi:GDPmannose 4,6-dehydratase